MEPLERLWQRPSPPDVDQWSEQKLKRGWTLRILVILGVILVLYTLLNMLKGFYTEWLWFDSLGYSAIYTTILKTKVLVFVIAAFIFAFLFLGNLLLATRLSPKSESFFWPWAIVRQLQWISRWTVILGTALLSLIFGVIVQDNWQMLLRFFNAQPFGVNDQVFNKEVSFYVFSLPFLQLIQGWLIGAFIITILGSAGIYLLSYFVQRKRFDYARPVLAHIGGLVIAVLGLFAWGYWLGIWELVFSEQGVIFGAGYTDMHARLPAQWILIGVVLICIGFFIVAIFRRHYRWALYGIGGWIVASIVIGGLFPVIMQRFQVQPSELAHETPYIEYNIEFTRKAFGLDRIDEQFFPAEQSPSQQDIVQNQVTINNIRLWDHRPLKDTYNQIESIRLYYDFYDIDVDRYTIDGNYQQVMLSARELSVEKFVGEAQTWVNRQLQYTHGYGIALSPVNKVSAEGLPELWVKNIPPVGIFDIEQPQIYYGEKTNHYVIVKTIAQEFDYPSTAGNVFCEYQGEGGIGLSGFIRRVAYAWELGDLNILISSELTPDSRLLYYRNIRQRVSHLAPFLKLDSDPYMVVIDGKLLWIQDAYTISGRYPYSEPYGSGLNYIRNSVKAVIDAYDGSVTFYVTEPEDALIQTYQAIFPDMFVPVEQMPESLRVHLRYPENMFDIQASVYRTYHMRDARLFYNKEDVWAVPREFYADNEQAMEPYYIIMRLPDEEKEEFLLMLPFTPANKNNTIGWLAARCDGENYGKLFAYHFPKDKLVYGPSQIENRIQQDTDITSLFTLWSQGGSRVIRGNLLLIPLGKSQLYVEPVFLQAKEGGIPELKRIIVAAGDRIVMEKTLEASIAAIFGADLPPIEPEVEPPAPEEPAEPVVEPVTDDVTALIAEARQHYDMAQQYLKAGDWAGYGRELDAMKTVLDRLAELTTEE